MSWRIRLGTDRSTQDYADSFACPEFVISSLFTIYGRERNKQKYIQTNQQDT